MPRRPRVAPGGFVYHVMNRANGRRRLFRKDEDFLAFYRVILQASQRLPVRILGWCVMPDHFHFVAWPKRDGDLSKYFGYLGLTHAARWQVAHKSVGTGHVYESRYRSFMMQKDAHVLSVLRFVENNPLRNGLVRRAEDWRWSSLHLRSTATEKLKTAEERECRELLLPKSEWPVDPPRGSWPALVNRSQSAEDESAFLTALRRGSPLGDPAWVKRTADRYDLHSTLRPRGRPFGWRKKK